MPTIQQAFENVNGASFIGLDTETDVKLKGGKKNPLQGKVTKRTIGANVMVFQNINGSGYGKMVARRLAKEGKDPASFELQPRKWGQRIEGTPFIEHKGQVYVEVIFLSAGVSQHLVDGVVVDPSTIDGMPGTKEESVQGGLDNKVIIRTYKANSIKRVTADKTTYLF